LDHPDVIKWISEELLVLIDDAGYFSTDCLEEMEPLLGSYPSGANADIVTGLPVSGRDLGLSISAEIYPGVLLPLFIGRALILLSSAKELAKTFISSIVSAVCMSRVSSASAALWILQSFQLPEVLVVLPRVLQSDEIDSILDYLKVITLYKYTRYCIIHFYTSVSSHLQRKASVLYNELRSSDNRSLC